MKPKLKIKKLGDGIYAYALYKNDRIKPIIKNISKSHALHLKKICLNLIEVPDTIEPIKDWYNFEKIVNVTADGYGKI